MINDSLNINDKNYNRDKMYEETIISAINYIHSFKATCNSEQAGENALS